MSYKVIVKPRASKAIRKLDQATRARVVRAIEALADEPRPVGVRKLAGNDDLYRIRVGTIRVVYSIDDVGLLVIVGIVGHRRDVYRDLD